MAFYGFYPLYLTNQVGIDERWIGLISSTGVALEILYVLGLERLRRRFGFGGIIILGGAASVFRLACLAFLPTPFFATCFQAVHGLTIVAFMIVPVMYLNAHAEEGFRNSIQGLYVMLVAGLFSIIGNIVSGQLAEIGLLTLYRGALLSCLLGLALIALSFRLTPKHPTSTPNLTSPTCSAPPTLILTILVKIPPFQPPPCSTGRTPGGNAPTSGRRHRPEHRSLCN
ncbi:MAG: MFS transporter [Candidatus Synoicihabitans palmerolidicus]|nr:MFS transporter [Candidatus Synoicihabitans palmerolidicus]